MKYSILSRILITLIMVLIHQISFSQTNFWTQTSLTNGRFDAININNSGHVFAGGEGRGTVYRSTDNGYSWDQANLSLAFNISSFEFSADRSPESLVFAGTDYGIFLSNNNGNSWENIGLQSNNVSAMLFTPNGNLYAGTRGNGIYLSSDTGKIWSPVGPSTLNVSSLKLHQNGSMFATAYNGGIYRSNDSGNNWSLVGLTTSSVRDLTIDNSGKIYAATMITIVDSETVFRSTDNGDTWENFWGLGAYYAPYGGIVSNALGHVFLGTYAGVYRSTGSSWWTAIISGLTDFVYSLAIAPNGILYAGGYSKGIYRSGSTVSVKDADNSIKTPNEFYLKQNYPNPFNSTTKIEFYLPKDSFVELKLFDLLGREVSTLLTNDMEKGKHEIQLNSHEIVSGTYIYQLKGRDFSLTKKLMILK